jgi:Tfp pilus assembly protein PilV
MMSNHEGSHPEYYQELCAIAASGQISESEFVELQDHLRQCEECRSTYAEFIDLLHSKLPLVDPEVIGSAKLPGFFPESSSYRERFLARARKEGLTVSNHSLQDSPSHKSGIWSWVRLGYAQVAAVAVAALLLAVGVLAYNLHQSNLRYLNLASERSSANTQARQGVTQESLESRTPSAVVPPTPLPTPPKAAAADAELAKVRTDHAAAEARSKTLEEQLTRVATELEALRSENEKTNVSREELGKKLKEAEQVANAIKDDLQEIRQARSKDSLTIGAQDLQIQELSEKLAEQAEILEQERILLEASRDVRDLMGARTFHIADVYDVDSKGKDQRSFGRVFTTEGKQLLIFYAFDLNDRNTAKRNASFQVWGKRGPTQSSAHSLGLFQIDDQKQNRWVLRFEDPRILAEIDSVFVTVEPPGGSAKPTGRQFLFAYLNTSR